MLVLNVELVMMVGLQYCVILRAHAGYIGNGFGYFPGEHANDVGNVI